MDSALLFIHLASVGAALGCLIMSALCELTTLGNRAAQALMLTGDERCTEAAVTSPTVLAAVVSGVLLLPLADPAGLLDPRVGLAALALLSHARAQRLAGHRSAAIGSGRRREFSRLSRQHHLACAVLFATLIGMLALTIGAMPELDPPSPSAALPQVI